MNFEWIRKFHPQQCHSIHWNPAWKSYIWMSYKFIWIAPLTRRFIAVTDWPLSLLNIVHVIYFTNHEVTAVCHPIFQLPRIYFLSFSDERLLCSFIFVYIAQTTSCCIPLLCISSWNAQVFFRFNRGTQYDMMLKTHISYSLLVALIQFYHGILCAISEQTILIL